jgi:type II secretory pathway component PulF
VLNDDLADFRPLSMNAKRGSSRLRLLTHGLAWVFFLALLAFVVPRAEAIFVDFGIPLPRLTGLLIRASHQVLPLTALVSFLFVAEWFLLDPQSDRAGATSGAWTGIMLALPLVLITLAVVALGQPLYSLVSRLSG